MKKEKQKTREEELKEGCGFQETYSKGSLCLRGNLCSDCQENLDCFEEGKQSALKQFERVERVVDEYFNHFNNLQFPCRIYASDFMKIAEELKAKLKEL